MPADYVSSEGKSDDSGELLLEGNPLTAKALVAAASGGMSELTGAQYTQPMSVSYKKQKTK